MADINYNYVVTGPDGQCTKEINPELLYMTIPAEWACLYQKLLVAVADFGEQMLMNCKASCKDTNKSIINCWHMFMSAIAAHQLGKNKLAETLIKYIKAQLKLIYRDSRCAEFDSMVTLPISPDGRLRALLGCDNDTKFYVDLETGELYEEYLEQTKKGTFVVDDNGNLNYE